MFDQQPQVNYNERQGWRAQIQPLDIKILDCFNTMNFLQIFCLPPHPLRAPLTRSQYISAGGLSL